MSVLEKIIFDKTLPLSNNTFTPALGGTKGQLKGSLNVNIMSVVTTLRRNRTTNTWYVFIFAVHMQWTYNVWTHMMDAWITDYRAAVAAPHGAISAHHCGENSRKVTPPTHRAETMRALHPSSCLSVDGGLSSARRRRRCLSASLIWHSHTPSSLSSRSCSVFSF